MKRLYVALAILWVVALAVFIATPARASGYLHAPDAVETGAPIVYSTDEAATVTLPAFVHRADLGTCTGVPSGSRWYISWSCPAGGSFSVTAPDVYIVLNARASAASGPASATTVVGSPPPAPPPPTPAPTVDLTLTGSLTDLGEGMTLLSFAADGRVYANFGAYVTVVDPPCPFRYSRLKGGMRGPRIGLDCPAGDYAVALGGLASAVTLWVDPLNVVPEADETNNVLVLP